MVTVVLIDTDAWSVGSWMANLVSKSEKQIKMKIQVVAHGWGGSTLSNGQVQVEDDMART